MKMVILNPTFLTRDNESRFYSSVFINSGSDNGNDKVFTMAIHPPAPVCFFVCSLASFIKFRLKTK